MSEPVPTKISTAGGAIVVLVANINGGDILKTVILTATGAVVSFAITVMLKLVVKWWRNRKG